MLHPFRTYRDLAAKAEDASVVRGVLRFLFVLGAFVSISATGRLTVAETALGMISFAWIPLVYAFALGLVLRLLAPQAPLVPLRAFALYLEAAGPWLLVLLVLAASLLFAPQPARPVIVLLGPLTLGALAYAFVLAFAFFRAAVGMNRVRALAAVVLVQVFAVAAALAYFLVAGQLLPMLPGSS